MGRPGWQTGGKTGASWRYRGRKQRPSAWPIRIIFLSGKTYRISAGRSPRARFMAAPVRNPYSRGAIISGNPCLECGACCAFYRASFYWGETDEITLGGVPADLTVKINERFVAMQGTRCHPPRCVALMGAIGVHVSCRIYERRASVCRSFPPSWEDNVHKPPL